MENNILKEYIEELNEKSIFYKTIGWEIISKYVKKDGLVNFKELSKEDRVMFDNNNKFVKSATYKLMCVYELFPQIIEGYSLAPVGNLENITIYPDLIDMRTKEHFISICGEKIKCPNEMTTQEYQVIFNNTIKNLLTSQKITPEMIEEAKYSNQEENKISTAPKR